MIQTDLCGEVDFPDTGPRDEEGLGLELMVVAGEASGDSHAAGLVRALQSARSDLSFFGMGGTQLREAGVELLFGSEEISVMGITEVVPKLWRIFQVLGALTRAAAERRPALAILVDVPDFNLRLARRLWRLGIPVVYYVSPKIWAWRRGRLKHIEKYVRRMLCILPFEEAFYRDTRVAARYVGNPVVEQVPKPGPTEGFRKQLGLDPSAPTLALLPGSRHSEIRRILPPLVQAARVLKQEDPNLVVLVPVAPGIHPREVEGHFEGSGVHPILVSGQAPAVVGASDAAIVASGTAVLEAGLMERPMVVVYRVSWLSYWVGRLLLRVAYVGLVNLLAGRRVVPELLQGDMNPRRVAAEIKQLLLPGPAREQVVEGLREVRKILGPRGAAERAAQEVLSMLETA